MLDNRATFNQRLDDRIQYPAFYAAVDAAHQIAAPDAAGRAHNPQHHLGIGLCAVFAHVVAHSGDESIHRPVDKRGAESHVLLRYFGAIDVAPVACAGQHNGHALDHFGGARPCLKNRIVIGPQDHLKCVGAVGRQRRLGGGAGGDNVHRRGVVRHARHGALGLDSAVLKCVQNLDRLDKAFRDGFLRHRMLVFWNALETLQNDEAVEKAAGDLA